MKCENKTKLWQLWRGNKRKDSIITNDYYFILQNNYALSHLRSENWVIQIHKSKIERQNRDTTIFFGQHYLKIYAYICGDFKLIYKA